MAAMEYTSKYCKYCGQQRKFERPGTNHILHLILSILTVGLWIPVWILSAIKIGGWRCSFCGKRA